MALPYDTTLLINVLRESAISVQNNNTNSDNKSSRIEAILGSVYNPLYLEKSVDIDSHFPILSKAIQQNSPPIQSNVLSYKNRYKTDKDSDLIKNPKTRSTSNPQPISRQSTRRHSDSSLKIIPSKSRRNGSITSIPESTVSATTSISTARESIQPPTSPTSSIPPPVQNKSLTKTTPFSKISNLIRQRRVSNTNTIDEENESSDASLTISTHDSRRESNNSSALEIAKARIPSFIMQRTQSELSSESDDIGLESDDEEEELLTKKNRSLDSDRFLDEDEDEYIPESLRYSDDDDDEFQDEFDSDDYLDESDYMIEDSLVESSSSALNMFKSQWDTDTNSISKINFSRARNNSNALSLKLGKPGSTVSSKYKNTGPFSLQSFTNNLPQLPPPPSQLPSTSYQNTTRLKQALKRNSKSFSGLLDANPLVEPTLDFTKREIKPTTPLGVKKSEKSSLTSAIRKLDSDPDSKLTLDYFEYAEHQQTASDKIISTSVSLPSLQISSLDLKANGSVTVFEFIGYVLFSIKKKGQVTLTSSQENPNHWILYLVDEDGEIEDDFGVLDRTRELQSYGADEFVLVECSDSDMEKNEVITPYLIQQSNEIESNHGSALELDPQKQVVVDRSHLGKALSLVTVPGGGVTPSSGVTISSQFQRQNSVRVAPPETAFSDYDSDEDASSSSNTKTLRLMKKPYRLNEPHTMTGTSLSTLKDSKLNRFKNSKTFQTLLHASANYYQQQHNTMLQQQLNQADGNQLPDLTSYHRWTVWRRQQMSFKTKHPKSLAVDGWQIYILPFNEINGSWSESKTSSFNISQVLKIKQSTKVPKYFKVIINKNYENEDAVLKKYYLEAKTIQECKEIVDTIKGLMTAYHREQLHGSIV